MGIYIAALAISLLPREHFIHDKVNLIEINHYGTYDENTGEIKLAFTQVIFYDWSVDYTRNIVRGWRMVKNSSTRPRKYWRGTGYRMIWNDKRQNDTLRITDSRHFRETWTTYDPEMLQRTLVPTENRIPLTKFSVMQDHPKKNRPPPEILEQE